MTKIAAHILNGSEIAKNYLESASKQIAQIRKSGDILTLGTVQVGESQDAMLYSKHLANLLGKLGIHLTPLTFSESVSEEELIDEIAMLTSNQDITGIMIFAPLPKKIDPSNILNHIDMMKDVEGRTFLKSHFGVFSPTANAVLTLLESTGCHFAGKEAVVVGHSDVVGKPTAVLLMDKLATVTVCHKETRDLEGHIRKADIVVAAAGKPHLIKGDWIKSGAIVIDVGENVVNGKLVGDVEFESAKERASFISPVPGGVGPVTNVMLVKNLIKLYELNRCLGGSNGNC